LARELQWYGGASRRGFREDSEQASKQSVPPQCHGEALAMGRSAVPRGEMHVAAARRPILKETYTIMATKKAVRGAKMGAKLTKKVQPAVKNLAVNAR